MLLIEEINYQSNEYNVGVKCKEQSKQHCPTQGQGQAIRGFRALINEYKTSARVY